MASLDTLTTLRDVEAAGWAFGLRCRECGHTGTLSWDIVRTRLKGYLSVSLERGERGSSVAPPSGL